MFFYYYYQNTQTNVCEERPSKVNTEARLTVAGPENCGMKGHENGQFKAYAKKKEGEKTQFFF